jgi:ATP-dependent DNA ligase
MNPAYRPMLATLVNEPFDDKAWVFETKWDGFRLITEKSSDIVRLWSRNGIDVTRKYAVLLPALRKIEGSCVIDVRALRTRRARALTLPAFAERPQQKGAVTLCSFRCTVRGPQGHP